MTKQVRITIEGIGIESEEDPIVIEADGLYHNRGGKHYIQFEEPSDNGRVPKSIIKIAEDQIDMKREGSNSTYMTFSLLEATHAQYQTPYGRLILCIHTSELKVTESEDELLVHMSYTLYENNSRLSDNRLQIKVYSR